MGSFLKKEYRAQTTIELLILLAVSLVALAIIYSLYSSQVTSNVLSKESVIASNTIKSLVSAANSLSISGAGSSTTVLVQIPDSLNMDASDVVGGTLVLQLSNGTDLIGRADVNFDGDWKKSNGAYVKGGYYMKLVFDGNVVHIIYDDFELSTESISFSAQQGALVQNYFNVRNDSQYLAVFFISNNFSHAPFATLSIDSSNNYFTLSPGETRRIDVNVLLSSSASGNYSGAITVIGQLNDGTSDTNVTKTLVVSAEVLPKLQDLMIYPKSTEVNVLAGNTVVKSFSICNASSTDISGFSWSRASNPNANMLTWFSWQPKTSQGVVINSVSNSDCNYFDLTITVPLGTPSKTYDSNFTVTNSGKSFTAYLYVTVN